MDEAVSVEGGEGKVPQWIGWPRAISALQIVRCGMRTESPFDTLTLEVCACASNQEDKGQEEQAERVGP